MSERVYVWTDRGVDNALANGVSTTEVIEALNAPTGQRYEQWLGRLMLLVAGPTETGRVIVVTLQRNASWSPVLWIVGARPLTDSERTEWRRRIQ